MNWKTMTALILPFVGTLVGACKHNKTAHQTLAASEATSKGPTGFYFAVNESWINRRIDPPSFPTVRGSEGNYRYRSDSSASFIKIDFVENLPSKNPSAEARVDVLVDIDVKTRIFNRRGRHIVTGKTTGNATKNLFVSNERVRTTPTRVNVGSNVSYHPLIGRRIFRRRHAGRVRGLLNGTVRSKTKSSVNEEVEKMSTKLNRLLAEQVQPLVEQKFPGDFRLFTKDSKQTWLLGNVKLGGATSVGPVPDLDAGADIYVRVHEKLINRWLEMNVNGRKLDGQWRKKMQQMPLAKQRMPIINQGESQSGDLFEKDVDIDSVEVGFEQDTIKLTLVTGHALRLAGDDTEQAEPVDVENVQQVLGEILEQPEPDRFKVSAKTSIVFKISEETGHYRLQRPQASVTDFWIKDNEAKMARVISNFEQDLAEEHPILRNLEATGKHLVENRLRSIVNEEISKAIDDTFADGIVMKEVGGVPFSRFAAKDGWLLIDMD